MSTPIKSSATTGSPALNELMNKLNAQASGAQGANSKDAQAQQQAFSRWLERHAIGNEASTVQGAAGKLGIQATPEAGALASRAAEQALARSRQQSAMAARSTHPAPPMASHHADKVAAPKAEAQASKPARANSASNTSNTSKADKADKADKPKDKATSETKPAETAFSTAMGEGAAVVRELTPPPTIQPGDAAGMMAWLASLTHADLSQGKLAAANAGQGEDAAAGGMAQAGTGDLPDDKALGKLSGAAGQGAIVLDSPQWKGAGADAALQVDALLAKSGHTGEARADGDPLASMLSGGALKGASFGQALSEAQAARHESATLPTPVNAPDFGQALADQVSMWVSSARTDGSMTAELHLNPAEMGPINVKIALDGQTAQVDFAAAAVETRQAIEASLPLLHSALGDVGLNMTGGDVSSQTSQQSFNQSSGQPAGSTGRSGSGLVDGDKALDGLGMRAVAPPRPGRLGGLDLYA